MQTNYIWRNCYLKELNIPPHWLNKDVYHIDTKRDDLFLVYCTQGELEDIIWPYIGDETHRKKIQEHLIKLYSLKGYPFLISRKLKFIQCWMNADPVSAGSLWESIGEIHFSTLDQLENLATTPVKKKFDISAASGEKYPNPFYKFSGAAKTGWRFELLKEGLFVYSDSNVKMHYASSELYPSWILIRSIQERGNWIEQNSIKATIDTDVYVAIRWKNESETEVNESAFYSLKANGWVEGGMFVLAEDAGRGRYRIFSKNVGKGDIICFLNEDLKKLVCKGSVFFMFKPIDNSFSKHRDFAHRFDGDI